MVAFAYTYVVHECNHQFELNNWVLFHIQMGLGISDKKHKKYDQRYFFLQSPKEN